MGTHEALTSIAMGKQNFSERILAVKSVAQQKVRIAQVHRGGTKM
jgi:hypothetical protein